MSTELRASTVAKEVDILLGCAFKSADFANAPPGLRLVRGDNVKRGMLEWGEKSRYWRNLTPDLERYRLCVGDIVVGMDGSRVGENFARISISDIPALLVQRVACLRAKDGLDQDFLRYLICNSAFTDYIKAVHTGTSIPHISGGQIGAYPILVPPLPEQRAIAHILGTLDDKIELNRRANETLEEMARALFKAWFVDFEPVRAKMEGRWRRGQSLPGLPAHFYDLFPDRLVDSELGEVPGGWWVKKIGDVITRLTVGKKYEQKTVTSEGRIPVLDQGKTGIIGYHNDEPGVMASVDTPVAVFANHTCFMRLISFPFSAIQNVLPFVGKGMPTIWTFYASVGKQPFIEYKGHWPDFVIHEIVVPPPNLAEEYTKVARGHLRLIWQNELETRSLAQLRDTLLPKLISGDLRIKDAEAFLKERGL